MAVVLVVSMSENRSGVLWNTYFQDVPDDGVAGVTGFINRLFELGISGGCGGVPPAANFCPNYFVLRKEMAVFLITSMEERGSTVPYDTYFSDIDDDGYAPFINRLYELGITGGCGGGEFCPEAEVTRGEMAVFLMPAFFRY
jgi:hypothetical protein